MNKLTTLEQAVSLIGDGACVGLGGNTLNRAPMAAVFEMVSQKKRSLRVVKGVARVPEQRTKDKTGGRHGDSAVACAMMLDARKELGSAEPWEYVGIELPGFDLNGW